MGEIIFFLVFSSEREENCYSDRQNIGTAENYKFYLFMPHWACARIVWFCPCVGRYGDFLFVKTNLLQHFPRLVGSRIPLYRSKYWRIPCVPSGFFTVCCHKDDILPVCSTIPESEFYRSPIQRLDASSRCPSCWTSVIVQDQVASVWFKLVVILTCVS